MVSQKRRAQELVSPCSHKRPRRNQDEGVSSTCMDCLRFVFQLFPFASLSSSPQISTKHEISDEEHSIESTLVQSLSPEESHLDVQSTSSTSPRNSLVQVSTRRFRGPGGAWQSPSKGRHLPSSIPTPPSDTQSLSDAIECEQLERELILSECDSAEDPSVVEHVEILPECDSDEDSSAVEQVERELTLPECESDEDLSVVERETALSECESDEDPFVEKVDIPNHSSVPQMTPVSVGRDSYRRPLLGKGYNISQSSKLSDRDNVNHQNVDNIRLQPNHSASQSSSIGSSFLKRSTQSKFKETPSVVPRRTRILPECDSVDDLPVKKVNNIRLQSSSSFQFSQTTDSSFPWVPTAQSKETFGSRLRPHRKAHILEKKHKATVRQRNQDGLKLRMYQVMKRHGKLVNGRNEEGMSLPDYQLLLEKLFVDRPSHLPSRFAKSKSPGISRESENLMKRTLEKANATLNSPKPPKPFVPSYENQKLRDRTKDAAIEQLLQRLPNQLPPEVDQEVTVILRKQGVVAKFAREQVSDGDISRLNPGQWLNDEIINFYGAMILARSEANKENIQVNGKAGGNGSLDIHYFNSFFWAKLTREGYEKGRLAKWTKKLNIFAKDVILIPINHSNAHWTAAAINFRKKRVESYDSMGLTNHVVFTHLRAYLDAEHREKKKKSFDFTGWEDVAPIDTPQQENGWDCGVFTCHFLEAISRGLDKFAFAQADMPYLRRRMIWEIGNEQLRSSDYR